MPRNKALLALTVALFATRLFAASAPDWLRAATKDSLPTYPADVDAVVLVDEQTTLVNDKGEIKTLYHRAYKILSSAGRKRNVLVVYSDPQTEISHLKGWAIPPTGEVYESKDKDAVETGITDVTFYSDRKRTILTVPYSEPGTVVGFEYQTIRRSDLLQQVWDFQETIPIREARFALSLPAGWESREHWANWIPQKSIALGSNQQMWELRDLPAVAQEPSMPAWRAVAGRMAISIIPGRGELRSQQQLTWNDFGLWYWQLASPSLQSDPALEAKVRELTAGHDDSWSKMQALAAYTQRSIRYVAIEVGLGGYQPHAVAQTLTNSYGDCKDKAALLNVMLSRIGVQSFLVLTHTDRGVVSPDFPTLYSFNHEVLAIALPASLSQDQSAIYHHPKLGSLLVFDPTDPMTPLGMLPSYLQGGRGLLVTSAGGEILDFPNQPADINRVQRSGTFTLTAVGGITGKVDEIRTGSYANQKRAELLALPQPDRAKAFEHFLSVFLQGFTLQTYSIDNLENFDQQLVLHYTFSAPTYARQMGDLLLVRPRVLGTKADMHFESEDRKFPLELDSVSVQNDKFEILLPEGYAVDELGTPVNQANDYARYISKTEQHGKTLNYERTYEIDKVVVPVDQIKAMRQFYRAVALDERSSAVLKKQ